MSYLKNLSRKYNWFCGFVVKPIPLYHCNELELSAETAELIRQHNSLVHLIKESAQQDYNSIKGREKPNV